MTSKTPRTEGLSATDPRLGQLAELTGQALQNAEAAGRLVDGIRTIAESFREVAIQRTERRRIRASAKVEIERIQAMRDIMLTYLDRSFDERRSNFDALFGALDKAAISGDIDTIAKTLDSIVALARSSPFKDLTDAATARAALTDKSREWEF